MDLGSNIKKYRKEAGLTQKELAGILGVAVGTVQQYELGKRQPRLETIRKMAIALNVYSYDLLYDKQTAEEKKQQEFTKMAINFINDGAITDEILIQNFNKLNKLGKSEANKRVEELTEINKYTEEDPEPPAL